MIEDLIDARIAALFVSLVRILERHLLDLFTRINAPYEFICIFAFELITTNGIPCLYNSFKASLSIGMTT